MEFKSNGYEKDHPMHESMFDGPYYKKSKIENESNGSHLATGDGSLIPTDTDELSLFDQPHNIFRQVSNSTKLPKTAFVIFLNSSKDAYFAQHPEASFKEFQSDSLVTWHALSSSEKTIWLQRETDSRKQFFEQVQGLIDLNPPPVLPGQENKPPPTSKLAFPTFVQAMRDQVLLENPTFTYNEIQKELSKAWKNMSRDEKRIWANAELDTPFPSTTRKTSYPRRSSTMPAPPKSAYSLFYQCARKQLIVEFPDLSGKEIPGVCSELWKNLPEAERALWQADAENDRLRYQRECALLAQENEILDSKSGALEKQPFDLHQDSPMSSAVEERMKPTARRKYAKSVKKDRMENPPKARKTSKKQFPESNSMFQNSQPHNDERNYFTPRSHDGNEDDPASALFGNDDPLKIPSHDSLFDDSLAYDANLFFDSDPFHADLDLFAGLSSPTSNRHLDSKPFLHEDLSLFGNESTSNFSL